MTGPWRIRLASACAVALYLAAAGVALPDARARSALHYGVVATLGYGHLIGAFTPELRRRGWLRSAAGAAGIANLLLLYALAVERWPAVVWVLLGAAAWHAVENDVAFAGAYASGRRPGPLPRRPGPHLACAAGALLTLAGAALCAAGRTPLAFADLFAASLLHHLVSWLLLAVHRLRGLGRSDCAEARRRAARLLLAHALPAAAAPFLLGAPGAAGALFAPPLYLFFSALHVAQTSWARGLEPRRRPAPA